MSNSCVRGLRDMLLVLMLPLVATMLAACMLIGAIEKVLLAFGAWPDAAVLELPPLRPWPDMVAMICLDSVALA